MVFPASLRAFQSAGNSPTLAFEKSSMVMQSESAAVGPDDPARPSSTRTTTGTISRRCIRLSETTLASAPPPVMDQVVDDLAELSDSATLLHVVARGRVQWHHAVADSPAPLPFRVQPDDALHSLTDEPQRPRLGIVVI